MSRDAMVDPTLEWSWLSREDLAEMADLRAAIEYMDDPVERFDLEHLTERFDHPDADPTRNAACGRNKSGTLVAYVWASPRGRAIGQPQVWLDWGIHPAHRHRNIGHLSVDWLVQRALDWREDHYTGQESSGRQTDRPALWAGCYVDEKLTQRCLVMQQAGFGVDRWYCDMHVSFEDTPVVDFRPHIDGIELVPFNNALSERVRQAHNEAFSTRPGSVPVSQEQWQFSLTTSSARPEWSWVAVHGDEVVGYALNSAYQQDWEPQGFSEGWTDRLGVVPAWRGKGLGRALVQASLGSFAAAGLAGGGLGVDLENPDGAVQLFQQFGYTDAESVVLYGQTWQ